MKVTVAKSAGFCFGVKRAVEQVYQQLETGKKPVYTYGPIIHNDQVVKELEQKGVRVIRSEEELERLGEGTVIIRSHGVSRRVQEKMEASGLTVADATCPFVKKIHRIVEEAGQKRTVRPYRRRPEPSGSPGNHRLDPGGFRSGGNSGGDGKTGASPGPRPLFCVPDDI